MGGGGGIPNNTQMSELEIVTMLRQRNKCIVYLFIFNIKFNNSNSVKKALFQNILFLQYRKKTSLKYQKI